jgi:two-component system invasion response regulator UvrY
LLIMDMSMPDKTGLDVLKQLRSESIKIPILILSIHPENQYAIRVLKAGGNGYITKDCPRVEFVNAVRIILSGKKYISAGIAEKLASRFNEDMSKEQHELISDRELQVLKLIASGKTVSGIADELSLSVPTISTYRSRLLEKMNLKTNAELTHYAINNHLV